MKLGPLGIPMKPAEDEPGTEAWSQLTNLDEWLAYKDVSRIHNLTKLENNHEEQEEEEEEEEEEEGYGEEGIVNIGSPTLGDVAAVNRKEDEDQGGGVTLDGLLQIEEEEEEIGRVIDDVIREEEQQQPSVSVEATNQVELQEEETKVDELPLLEQPSSSVDQQQDQEMIAVEPEPEPEAEPQQEQQPEEEEEATTPGHEEEAPVMEPEQEEEKEEVAVEEDLESFEPREEEDGGYLEDGYEEEEDMHTTTNRKSSIDLTSTLTLHQQQQHLLNKMQREELEQRFIRIEAHFRAEQATRAATESQLALLQREKDTLVEMIGQLSSQLSSSKKKPPVSSSSVATIHGQQQEQRGISRQRHFFLADTESSKLARAASLPLSSASSLTEMDRKKMEAELKKLADKAKNAESAMKGVKAAVENALGTLVVASSSGGEGPPVSVMTKTGASSRPPFVTKTTTVKKVIERKPY